MLIHPAAPKSMGVGMDQPRPPPQPTRAEHARNVIPPVGRNAGGSLCDKSAPLGVACSAQGAGCWCFRTPAALPRKSSGPSSEPSVCVVPVRTVKTQKSRAPASVPRPRCIGSRRMACWNTWPERSLWHGNRALEAPGSAGKHWKH